MTNLETKLFHILTCKTVHFSTRCCTAFSSSTPACTNPFVYFENYGFEKNEAWREGRRGAYGSIMDLKSTSHYVISLYKRNY